MLLHNAKPNIILFHCHDMGRWIEPLGYPVPTPHMVAFAEEAMVFRRAFCAAPTCSPSRSAMLTGMTAHQAGMLGLAHRGFGPTDATRHLANFLKAQGYFTLLAGIQHETAEEGIPALGYEERINGDEEFRGANERDLHVAQKLRARLNEPLPDKPLFLFFGTFLPHRDFPEPEPGSDHLVPPFPVSDSPEGRLDFEGFRAATGIADACFGQLLDALRESGRFENSIILATTDHGPAFPGMKCSLHDTGIGVTLMVRKPAGGRGMSESMVSHLDIFPTLCELAGLEKPAWLQGHSLLPVMDDPAAIIRDQLFAEVTYHAAYEPMRCIRTKTHKLIRHFDPRRLRPVLANVDNGPEKERLLRTSWEHFARQPLEFYDLEVDPFETRNLADDPIHADMRDALLAQLESWMRETQDPLLETAPRVPAPVGAKVNTLESRQPTEKILESVEEYHP